MKFKKGDRVRVWSLQSFSGGGFLNGEPAVVRQSQFQEGDSVILAVVRKKDGVYKLDKSYEVYAKQCELLEEAPKPKSEYSEGDSQSEYEIAKEELEEYRIELLNNKYIS
jgi:hypothetical protein